MCLAIPGKIVEISEQEIAAFRTAKVNFDGIVKDVNLSLVPEAEVGNYVLVHVGLALNTIDEDEAMKTLQLLKEMGEIDLGEQFD
jgi:hydrogenase expression/formation protein HypC